MIKIIIVKRISLIMLFVLIISACTSTSNLYNPNYINVSSEVHVGDKVTIYKKSGEEVEIVIREIQEERIIGSSETIEFKDIKRIKIIKLTDNKSTIRTGMIIIELLAIIAAVLYIKYNGGYN